MRRELKTLLAFGALLGLTACATPEHADQFFFGAATEANIDTHSERPSELPNSEAVEGSSGKRAADAVRRLRERPATGG
mgnify:CR=1 FL=1